MVGRSARAWSKAPVGTWSKIAWNSRACAGRSPEPRPCWLCARSMRMGIGKRFITFGASAATNNSMANRSTRRGLIQSNDSRSTRFSHTLIIYKDEVGAICRRWNWKEADRTKLTQDTKNAFLVIETLPPVTRDTVETAIRELVDLVTVVWRKNRNG